jgi:hypothetical protein
VLQLRDEIEALIEQFHKKCNELKAVVRQADQTLIDDTGAVLAGESKS